MGNLKMDIPEKLATLWYTIHRTDTNQKTRHYAHTSTNNIRLYQFFKIISL